MTEKHELKKKLIKAVELCGGQAAFAKKYCFSRTYITDVINGRRDISDRLANALGYKMQKIFTEIK